jgi:NAD(P)-dependent dehydrogenase (short-subunit alcohol dehydrogenase family)
MELELQGKVVLITGGSRGIGLACAKAFAAEGARVAIAGRSADALNNAVRALQADGYVVHSESIDLNDTHALQQGLARVEAVLGQIDILVNSAGASKHHSPDSTDSGRWIQGMQDKYVPMLNAIDAVVPRMAARSGGVVINIVGIAGKVASPTHMAGGGANAALLLVSASLAKIWGPKGVRVNVINPGPTETDRLLASLSVKAKVAGKSLDEQRFEGVSRIPLGRFGQPEDVASMAVFLASARAAYVSGAVIPIDGGANAAP